MPNIVLTKKIKSFKIYPAIEASFDVLNSRMNVVWGSEIPLPDSFSRIGWDSVVATPTQRSGYSGSRPVTDSNGLYGSITVTVAAPKKKASFEQDSLRLDNLILEASRNLLPNYPYFRVDVIREDDRQYSLVASLSISKGDKMSGVWSIELKPDRVLDNDISVGSFSLDILKIQASTISPTKIKISFKTNKPSKGFLLTGVDGSEALTNTVEGSASSYNHIFTVEVRDYVEILNYKCKAVASDGSEESITELFKYYKVNGEGNSLAIANPKFIRGSFDGEGYVSWSTDRPATSYVKVGVDRSLSDAFYSSDLSSSHSLKVFFPSGSDFVYFQVVSVDPDGVRASSDIVKAYNTAEDVPVVSNLRAINSGDDTITIVFSTDRACTSEVEFGTSKTLGSVQVSEPSPTTIHTTTILGLVPDTEYYFRAKATDNSLIGFSYLISATTNIASAPEATSFFVNPDSFDFDREMVDISANQNCRFQAVYSDDRNFNKVNTTPIRPFLSNSDRIFIDTSMYQEGVEIFVKVIMSNEEGVSSETHTLKTIKRASINPTIHDIYLIKQDLDEVTIYLRTLTQERVYLQLSRFEDMSEAEGTMASTGFDHEITINTNSLKSEMGEDVWFRGVVLSPTSQPLSYTYPKKFTRLDLKSPLFSDVTIERSYGRSGTVIVKGVSNIKTNSFVEWGFERDNLKYRTPSSGVSRTDHSIELVLDDRDLSNDDIIWVRLGGSIEDHTAGYSDMVSYRYRQNVLPPSITEVQDTPTTVGGQRDILFKTSRPCTSSVSYGLGADRSSRASLTEFSLEHVLTIDVSDIPAGSEYRYDISVTSSEGLSGNINNLSGTRLDSSGIIHDIEVSGVDETTFIVDCLTLEPGVVRITYSETEGGLPHYTTQYTEFTNIKHRAYVGAGLVSSPGQTLYYRVDFKPESGDPNVLSGWYPVTLALSGKTCFFENIQAKAHPTYDNVFRVEALISRSGYVGFGIGFDLGGLSKEFYYINLAGYNFTEHLIDIVAPHDSKDIGEIIITPRTIPEEVTEDSDYWKPLSKSVVTESNTGTILANAISGVNLSEAGGEAAITWNFNPPLGNTQRYHWLLYSLDGDRYFLSEASNNNTQSSFSPRMVVPLTGLQDGDTFYYRPVSRIAESSPTTDVHEYWHIGDVYSYVVGS